LATSSISTTCLQNAGDNSQFLGQGRVAFKILKEPGHGKAGVRLDVNVQVQKGFWPGKDFDSFPWAIGRLTLHTNFCWRGVPQATAGPPSATHFRCWESRSLAAWSMATRRTERVLVFLSTTRTPSRRHLRP
jgi:hypothetical protein